MAFLAKASTAHVLHLHPPANMFGIYEYKLAGQKLALNAPSIMLQAVMIYHPLRTNAKPAAFVQKSAAQVKRF